ncbi:MAG: FKBP-type peptidyl-prolyl cis-trans isomerase [marine benthic group bacterium]|jgi:FKBP-type peptidyl-prolyl cis-trans isomerase FkpA|nr:FKBP-type peptidyl-prolyl cis-trans isomerase [Gemmatimonadota bacterium]MCL7963667.1 FKBP-type peptidyl-prolyl cis-trans isomerase [Candidatus Carthagonibacter metallireducens]MCL7964241.1 FKBP-type peptidyl-prolyl cis-trans isomerase [Gemmatimonadota bacterium]MCL7967318.1 FKBP-type peptidyl-prolyl cis-trans isomerase [Gemmatimonadota bacterium]MCL7969612.1 FKBP-type peptidyl-prolyl cis-trans isomerase [Gemmatimonadota bacterium]
MRIFSRHVVLTGLLAALAACGGAGDADESGAAGTPDPIDTEPRPEFAVDLNIDLDEMQRSGSGLYMRDVVEGTGLAARPSHVVTVHYTGWLPTGDKFDSSVDRNEPYSFQLGRRQVIAGWEEGIEGMRIGTKRILVIPPDLAYGARGRPGAIPPNAYLVFEVELLDIQM